MTIRDARTGEGSLSRLFFILAVVAAIALITSPVHAKKPAPGPQSKTSLVIEVNDSGLKLVPVSFIGDALTAAAPVASEAGSAASAASSHEAGRRACVAFKRGEEVLLTHHNLESPGAAPVTLSLGDFLVTSTLTRGDRCYLGGLGGEVRVADFSTTTPGVEVAHPPEQGGISAYKPIDFFVETPGTLLAIDDMVSPFFSVSFERAVDGVLSRPEVRVIGHQINGHYQEGIFARGEVYLLHTTSHRGGYGQAVSVYAPEAFRAPVPVDKDAARFMPSLWGVGESQARQDKARKSLMAGSDYSRWGGLGVLEDRLFVGAGERGVMSVLIPPKGAGEDFDHAAMLHDIGGECLDLVVVDDVAFALRKNGEAASLVALRWEGGALKEITSVALKGEVVGFVD